MEYTPGTKAGGYRPTPPDFKPAALVQWGSVTPFVLKSSDQFRCPEPPAVDSSRALADLEEVKAIGGSKSLTRTAEQSEIARYWYESSPQGWNRIAREVLAARQFDVGERPTVCVGKSRDGRGLHRGFRHKYHYNYWRPVTAIREGGDKEWVSYLPTPPPGLPFEPYGRRGCCGYGDGPVLQHRLRQFLNDERRTLPGHHPQVLELLEAARENGASRVLCGIHFSTAVNAGYTQGACIGDWVSNTHCGLRALRRRAPLRLCQKKRRLKGTVPSHSRQ